jgi:perosamine synthetase
VSTRIGLAQPERVEQLVEAKRRIFGWHEEELSGVAGVTLNREAEWARSINWMTSVIVEPEARIDRDGPRRALREAAAGNGR